MYMYLNCDFKVFFNMWNVMCVCCVCRYIYTKITCKYLNYIFCILVNKWNAICICCVGYLYKYIDVIYTFMYSSYDLCILVSIRTINCVHEIDVPLHACIWIVHYALFSIYIYIHYMCVQIYYLFFVYKNVLDICKMYLHCLILDKCIFMDVSIPNHII
jgi:hypothetical protein